MAIYDGFLADVFESERGRGLVLNADYGGLQCFRWTMEDGGRSGQCMRIKAGGAYSLWIGCDAGTRAVSIWTKFGADADPRIEVWDIFCGQRVASAETIGDGTDWEQIVAEWTAEKKIYLLKLVNYGHKDYSQIASRVALFDDLLVE